ncbi:peptide synthetase [Coprinopsis marcescibilis]|uniref:Peptide synthetase n=1 Tax=Coprinopsis marcescibilis TaxID=230819 RepID=A0A5C3LB39_COPMA|nr:peptide synthetase [Coprinopsis marcescibilis]
MAHADKAVNQLLEGYSIVEWPDLSCDRNPANVTNTASQPFANFTRSSRGNLLLAVVSRVISLYCGFNDILLSVQSRNRSNYAFVRVTWSANDTWEQIASKVASHLSSSKDHVRLTDLRRVSELPAKQYPCPLLVQFSHPEDSLLGSDFPAIIQFNPKRSTLGLSALSTLIHPSVTEQILGQIVFLFRHAEAHWSSRVDSIPPFPSQLLSVYNRVSNDEISRAYSHIPLVTFVTEYLSRRAKSDPDDLAVQWFPELLTDVPLSELHCESITYGELDRRASQFARWLVAQGLHSEDRVALCLQRDLRFHVALIGILRAGGCYVPIDPDLPDERRAYIAQDSNAAFVLTSHAQVSNVDIFGSRAVCIDDPQVESSIYTESTEYFNVATPEGLSYMLYTSGTTGNPKGCLLTNHGLTQAIFALSNTAANVRMDNIRDGRYLAVASIAFDVHLGETLVPIALGMPLRSAPRSQLLENLPAYAKALEITHLGIVPSLIEATLNAAKDDEGGTVLRYIASGGEKMSDSILDKWANHKQVKLANFYGPSEVTIGCCARFMDSITPRANIGKPLANVSGYVVDADMNILPRGALGELVVEGPLVGRGYHGRPDLTAKVFLEWPSAGCWAYRTGDLVRMMPDSTLEILGRIDTQIKLRGVRIESEGISAIVRKGSPSSEMVLDATTVLAKHPALGTDQLVSFVTWDPTVPVSVRKAKRPSLATPPKLLIKSIRSICQSELASYMRPNHIVPLNWLPLSSNGKTDAKILVEIFKSLDITDLASLITDESDDRIPLRECTQQELDIFRILETHVPSYDLHPTPELNIFECGLDSMGVIRFASDLKEHSGKIVSATRIMKDPFLKDISRLLESSADGEVSASILPLVDAKTRETLYSSYPANSIEDLLPAFPVQEGVLARSAEDDTLYVQHVVLELQQPISLSRLKTAWETVITSHPILRTVFHLDRQVTQVVFRSWNMNDLWSDHAVDTSTSEEFEAFFYRRFADVVTKNINRQLSSLPPFRISAFRSSQQQHFVLSIHHALYDGTSLPWLLSDVESVYSGLDRIPTASLKDILREITKQDPTSAQKFWLDVYHDFRWPSAVFESPLSPEIKHLAVPFRSSLNFVKEIASREQVTLQALLSFIFAHLIGSQLYHSRDVSFGTIRSGRMLPVDNIDFALCPTITVLPMRITLKDNASTLKTIQAGISAMTEHEHVPLGKIQNWVRPGEPLFEVLFSVSVHQSKKSKLWVHRDYQPPAADYPLSVEAVINAQEDTLSIRAAWLEGQVSGDLVSHIVNNFESAALQIGEKEDLWSSISTTSGRHTDSLAVTRATQEGRIELTADPVVLDTLRQTIGEFLEVPPTVLNGRVSFISLGLDSIKAVGLAKRIRKLGYEVTSVEILKASTLHRLARNISSVKPKPQEPLEQYMQLLAQLENHQQKSELRFNSEDRCKIYPATALQSGMLSQTIGTDGKLYIHSFPVTLPPGTDFDRLQLAWESAAKVIDLLRTSFHFVPDSGLWAQVVHSVGALNWTVQEVVDTDESASAIQEFIESIQCVDEFAFSKPPIWLRLFKSKSHLTPSVLALVMHHALYDGPSIERLFNVVQAIYRGEGDSISYLTQFSDLLPDFFRQEMEGTAFWVKHLAGFSRSTLPTRVVESRVTHHKIIRPVVVDSLRLATLLKSSESTIQCLLQASLAKALATITRRPDVVFGHVVSGRGTQGTEDVVGPILNTVPCRVILKDGTTVSDLLRSIHRSNMDVTSWQQASLRSIQKAMKVDRLWDCLFTFQPAVPDSAEEQTWKLVSAEAEVMHIQYPLHVEIEQTTDGFVVRCICVSNVFDEEHLEEFVQSLVCTIDTFVNDHEQAAIRDTGLFSAKNESQPIPDAKPVAHTVNTRQEITIPPALLSTIRSIVSDAEISIDTPLPALGIDSITAIQISGKCRRLGLRVSATEILNARTLRDLVISLGKTTGQEVPQALGLKGIFQELSSAEKESIATRFGGAAKFIENISVSSAGMKWAIGGWQKTSGSLFQHVFAFKLPDDIDHGRFKNAWHMLVRRHHILRSTFATAPGGTEPRIVTFSKGFRFQHWAEQVVGDSVVYRQLLQRMKEMVSDPLSIHRPPVRGTLFRSSKHAFFVLHIHHFQYDAWSMQVLLNDLSSIYHEKEPWAVSDLKSFLSLFNPNESRLGRQQQYWQSALSTSFEPSLLPSLLHSSVDRRKLTGLPQLNIVPFALKNISLYDIKARTLNVTLQTVLLAAWARVQANRSAANDSTFGVWQVGRSGHMDGIERLAVPCVNVLPIHVNLGGTILDTAKRIQEDLRRRLSEPVIEHSDLVNISKWVGMSARTPIFNVNVNILKIPVMLKKEGLLEPMKAPHHIPNNSVPTVTPTFDELAVSPLVENDVVVDIVIFEDTDRIAMSIEARDTIMTKEQAEGIVDEWASIVSNTLEGL